MKMSGDELSHLGVKHVDREGQLAASCRCCFNGDDTWMLKVELLEYKIVGLLAKAEVKDMQVQTTHMELQDVQVQTVHMEAAAEAPTKEAAVVFDAAEAPPGEGAFDEVAAVIPKVQSAGGVVAADDLQPGLPPAFELKGESKAML